MKKAFIGFSVGIAIVSVLLIIFLATGLWKNIFYPKTDDHLGTRVVIPREANSFSLSGQTEYVSWGSGLNTKVPMEDGEAVIAILNKTNEDGQDEEQFVVYHIPSSPEKKAYITYINYDERTRIYKRIWNEAVAAARPETIYIFSQDIIGDRNNCIVVTGVNNNNEHTMTIFRQTFSSAGQLSEQPFEKIAELQIDGSIAIQETVRSLAYQQGIANGQSFNIAAYGQDKTSNNILDQIETIYSFDTSSGQYERTKVTRIPGSQIEQRRLRELLSGTPGVFENFLNDLWYYVSPQGTIDSRQYMYFNFEAREIIFFGDEAQQIFNWQNSTYTRYGMYIRSQNISITTLHRFIDIELVSLDSVRLKVTEDVRLRIAANTTWDGLYRRAGTVNLQEDLPAIKQNINAVYDSSWGRIRFQTNGEYTIYAGNSANAVSRNGHYVIYRIDDHELIELRAETGNDASGRPERTVYKMDSTGTAVSLSRVRIGISGIQELFEQPVILTPVEN